MAAHKSCFRQVQIYYTLLIYILISLPLVAFGADGRQPESIDNITVISVIDGDTIKINGGSVVRYIGIDTPERGEPLYREARERNRRLLEGGQIHLEICRGEERDRYGRLLAWLYSDGKLINAAILREGYAMLMVIAPCGLEKSPILQASLREAIEERRGLWTGLKTIPFGEAHHYIERYMRVTGTVESIHDSGKAIYLHFSARKKQGFYAVIFKKNLELFRSAGIAPREYIGKRVAIAGKVKGYRGRPEIIVESPYQVEISKEQ